jgi:glutathione S-transferase
MSRPTLVIGDKNKSSWSLRPWLALKLAGVDFEEKLVFLDKKETRAAIKAAAPGAAGKVPIYLDGEVVVWESLAICETIAETNPELWPAQRAARAHARAISNEMHAGFLPLRRSCPFDLKKLLEGQTINPEAGADVYRITRIWRETRERFGSGGPYLFGAKPNIADCMYAPVVARITSYGIPIDEAARAYVDAIWALPAMQEWKQAALTEP